MKKLLLLGAATLMSASAAWADIRYFQVGEPLSGTAQEVIAKMKEHQENGGLYFIQMAKKEVTTSNFLFSVDNSDEEFRWNYAGYTPISENGETNNNKVFRLAFEEGTDNFTVQNLFTNHYISIQGRNGYGKHNAKYTVDGTGSFSGRPLTIAQYTVADIADKSILHDEDALKDNRYLVKMTNATRDNDGTTTVYWQSYNDIDAASKSFGFVSYQSYTNGNQTAQVAFFPVKAVESTPITVHFPDWSGVAMTVEVEAYEGYNAEPFIAEAAKGYGDISDMAITSTNGTDLIVSGTNKEFTVTGNWNLDFEAYQVYRICLNPTDKPSALRYMLQDEEIRTKVDGEETLSRLIPERLWFFQPGTEPNTYSLHNLYDPSKGVHFSPDNNGSYNNAKATYETEVTYFNMIHKDADNQFYLKIDGTDDAYVNDFGGKGYFSILHTATPDNGCILQLYPLEARDMEALKLPANTAPTVDNISGPVAEYNAQNIAAAIRRIEYWGGEQLVGWQPGRFNNATDDFPEKLARAKELLAMGEAADADEVKAIVEEISFTKLTKFNAIKPGMFYRFKNKLSGMYMSSIAGGSYTLGNPQITRTFMELVTADKAKFSNTVFYIDGSENGPWTIVSFDTGLVLPTFNSASATWIPVVQGKDDASSLYSIVHQHLGGCVIHSDGTGNSHRHLYGGEKSSPTGVVLASGNSTNDGHQWYVELVEELPVTFYNVFGQEGYDNEGWTSVYSPVALELPAAYTHTKAYTGMFDDADYSEKDDINHIHATPIEPTDGKVIIPAKQPALLHYDGALDVESNPNLEQGSEDKGRDHIVYLNLPIHYDIESTGEAKGNIQSSFFAFNNAEGKDFFTLHASHNNNFRHYENYGQATDHDYIPGFKAYLEMPHAEEGEEETMYPIYLHNPNKMVAVDGEEGFKYEVSEDKEGDVIVTVTTASDEYDVYFKHSAPAKQSAQRRIVDHSGYEWATKNGNVHTFTVQNGDNVEYYAYHAGSDFKGVVRKATVNTTGIDEIMTEGSSAKVYDLQGRKLAAPLKGINIINGKKVFVK